MMKRFKFGLVSLLSVGLLTSFGYCDLTSMECQTTYNLIPIESVDTNYAVQNNLCPLESSGVEWSSLYINDIQHVSSPEINIYIPEEYNRNYTGDENKFDLFISGYNVDYEYIDNIIRTQKSTPSSEDFNNIVSGLIPLLIPGLVIILFIWFIFRFIKKII